MAECDVRLSADGVPFLLHDDTLERTTNGHGPAGERVWAELAPLEAGRWHSPSYAGERLPTLQDLAHACLERGAMVNLEIKPSPGTAQTTGATVAKVARQLWAGHGAGQPGGPPWPLLTSFDPSALEAARQAAPELPRGLLLDHLWPEAWNCAQALGCVAVVAHHPLWTPELIRQAHSHGWRTLAYTVNNAADAERLLAWGLDGLISDAVNTLGPGAPLSADRAATPPPSP